MSRRKDGTTTLYRVCPICGCSLDPGERCDCLEEAEARKSMPIKTRPKHTKTTAPKVNTVNPAAYRTSGGRCITI